MSIYSRMLVRLGLGMAISAILVSGAIAQELTFGYVVASLKIPYNVITKKGFEEAAREAGVNAIVIDPDGDVEKQAQAIDQLIKHGVDGIGFLPMDSLRAQSFADEGREKNIPVVSVAVQVGDSDRKLRDVYPNLSALVTTDDIAIGERAADLALGLLQADGKAKIGIVEGAPGYASVTLRTLGFKSQLVAKDFDFDIVASEPTDWTPESGEAICAKMIAAHPDIDLIFSHADPMGIGCSRAIAAAGSKTKLVSTGGGSKEGNNAISTGTMDGSICTRPELLGRLMLKVLYDAATNPTAPRGQFVTYESAMITKNTLGNCPPEW